MLTSSLNVLTVYIYLGLLRERSEALLEKRPLYAGFGGFTTYQTR